MCVIISNIFSIILMSLYFTNRGFYLSSSHRILQSINLSDNMKTITCITRFYLLLLTVLFIIGTNFVIKHSIVLVMVR